MFCSKCGKQIDDDSRFCPFCGNVIKAGSVQKDTKDFASNMQGSVKSATAEGQKVKKPAPVKLIACGAAAAAVLVIACIFIFRPSGGGQIEKSFLGKMFSLTWSEISDMTARDVRNLLKEEDIRYKYMEEEEYGVLYWGVMTEETSKFMGSDAIYLGVSDSLNYSQCFFVLYETRDDCQDSYEDIRHYLDRNLVKNTTGIDLMSDAFMQSNLSMWIGGFPSSYGPLKIRESTMYLMEECTDDEVLDQYLDRRVQIAMQAGEEVPDSESIAEARKELEGQGYGIYKVVVLYYGTADSISGLFEDFAGGMFEELDLSLSDASYSNNICMAEIRYVPADKDGFTSMFAMFGWDSLSGKEIDTEKAKSSLDAGFQAAVGKQTGGDEAAETAAYSALYMMDKYNYDVFEGRYIDKEDRNFWYIDNFEYDMDKGEEVDLSDYRNSAEVYCAAEYNYNVDEAAYFESDLDRVLYLVNRGYNLETGGTFSSNDEKRLWVMANYGYDIVAGKAVDKEVGEALLAYQDFMTTYRDSDYNPYRDPDYGWFDTERDIVFKLCFVDDNDVPELYVDHFIYCYKDGQVIPLTSWRAEVAYIERMGKIYLLDSGSGWGEIHFYDLQNGVLIETDSCSHYSDWDRDTLESWFSASINGQFFEEDEYWSREAQMTRGYTHISTPFDGSDPYDSDGGYHDVLSAYDAARTTIYYANMPEIDEFELSNGVLTASTNDGSKYGWYSREPFSFSYPVADDCIWEYGWYEADFVKDKDISYEELKEMITSDFEWYESLYKKNGKEWFDEYGIESPLSIQITVTDGIVVKVRVSSP